MSRERRATVGRLLAVIAASSSIMGALAVDPRAASAELVIPFVTPWMDRHDRIEATASSLRPEVVVRRFELEREGAYRSTDWYPAFGAATVVPLDGPLVILEGVAASALARLRDERGRPLDEALEAWVRQGGHLLVVGGSPSIDTYAGSPLEALMGFRPSEDPGILGRRTRHGLVGEEFAGLYAQRVHRGKATTARVRIRAGDTPFVLENRFGAGHVTTVLAGAQGKLRDDGPPDTSEWFASRAWAEFLRAEIEKAAGTSYSIGPAPPRPVPPSLAAREAFDIRYFMIANQPYPFSLAPGEAFARALELRRLGFTSVVVARAESRHVDLRTLGEIADAGLRIVYYDRISRKSHESRFSAVSGPPGRARNASGEDMGWDVHDPRFRAAPQHLLAGREEIPDLPLRALQIIEEFPDGDATGPALEALLAARGLDWKLPPADPGFIEVAAARATATAETFQRFRAAGRKLFPGLPQSAYLPGSYWGVPNVYGYRLTGLAEAVDELIAPAYGYSHPDRKVGVSSVELAASWAWSAIRTSSSATPHVAVYALGRPLVRGARPPDLASWRETAWTALAQGANGLAYWALPSGPAISGLGPLHAELSEIGPWLSALPRTPAPVAVLASWTSRSEGNSEQQKRLAGCLTTVPAALEFGFEDVDLVFEERLDLLTPATRAVVIVASPALSEGAVPDLVRFVKAGGHLFIEPGSAVRMQPGARPIDLAELTGQPTRVHAISLPVSCRVAPWIPSVAASQWRAALGDAGIAPRVDTADAETAAGLRGGPELWHVYAVNHGDSPAVVTVRLSTPLAGRSWIELRSGVRATPGEANELKTPGSIGVGEAAVWASVRRPLHTLSASLEHDSGRAVLRVEVRDEDDEPVAPGYPVRVEFEGPRECVGSGSVSTTLVDGQAAIGLDCGAPLSAAVRFIVTDPLTGRSLSSKAPDQAGVQ